VNFKHQVNLITNSIGRQRISSKDHQHTDPSFSFYDLDHCLFLRKCNCRMPLASRRSCCTTWKWTTTMGISRRWGWYCLCVPTSDAGAGYWWQNTFWSSRYADFCNDARNRGIVISSRTYRSDIFFQHGCHFLPEQKKQLNGRLGTRTCLRLDQLLVLLHPPLTNHHRPLIWPTVYGRDFSARAFGGSNDGSPSPAGISTSISLVRHSSRCRGIHSCGSTASDLGSHSCHRDSLPWRGFVDLSVPWRASLTFLYALMVVSQRTRHDVYSAVEGPQPLPSLNRSVEDSLRR